MTKSELRAITEELFADLAELKIKLGRIGKFNPEAVVETYGIILEVVQKIEAYSAQIRPLSGEEKKEVAVNLINDIVDIPWMPEYLEGAIFGWSIDLVVKVFNDIGGRAWLDNIIGKPSEEVQ